VAPTGFEERLRETHSESLLCEPALCRYVALTHAPRVNKIRGRTARLMEYLQDKVGLRDVPLFHGEDVPHDTTGYPLEKRHCVAELEFVSKVLEEHRPILEQAAAEGRLFLFGAVARQAADIFFGKESAKLSPQMPHPSIWNKQEAVTAAHQILAGAIPDFPTKDEFLDDVRRIISEAFAETNTDPDVSQRRTDANLKAWTDDRKENYGKAITDSWKDPSVRQKRIDGMGRANARPEVQERRSTARKDVNSRPGVKEKQRTESLRVAQMPGESERRSNLRRNEWANTTQKERADRAEAIRVGKANKKAKLTQEERDERAKRYRDIALAREKAKRAKRAEGAIEGAEEAAAAAE
jgi:hypothetical protein